MMFFLQKWLSTSTGTKKGFHVNSKERLTVNGNFCSSIWRNEHERSFLPTIRRGLHALTHIHYDDAEARKLMRRTPRHHHAKHWNETPNYQVHTCCQYKGEAILRQLEENRQTLRERRSNLRHILRLLARASRAKHPWTPFLNHSNLSGSCLCAWARFSICLWSAEQLRNFVQGWRPGTARMSPCDRNSALCFQMHALDPWTWLAWERVLTHVVRTYKYKQQQEPPSKQSALQNLELIPNRTVTL